MLEGIKNLFKTKPKELPIHEGPITPVLDMDNGTWGNAVYWDDFTNDKVMGFKDNPRVVDGDFIAISMKIAGRVAVRLNNVEYVKTVNGPHDLFKADVVWANS